jgi:hypothetical protein
MENDGIEIGRLLRSGSFGFVVGCRVNQLSAPTLGALVRVPLDQGDEVFGLIQDIHIDDDGLVRQLASSDIVDEDVIADNRDNRNVPVEMTVLTVGYRHKDEIRHLLPPRPPLSLNTIYLCTEKEICNFTTTGHFGYFRHILRSRDFPVGELLAAHLQQAHIAQQKRHPTWISDAIKELIVLLRDDYTALIPVLGALADVFPEGWAKSEV